MSEQEQRIKELIEGLAHQWELGAIPSLVVDLAQDVYKRLAEQERRVKGLEWLAHGDGFEPGEEAIQVTLTPDQITLLLNVTSQVDGLPMRFRDSMADAREQLKIALAKFRNPAEKGAIYDTH